MKYFGKVVRLDTNGQGYLLNKGRVVMKELKEAGIDKICVSLNVHDAVTYNQICKPRFENAFERVLEFVQKAKEEDLDTEITAVTIPEADISKVKEIAERIGVKFRVREYIHPASGKKSYHMKVGARAVSKSQLLPRNPRHS